jgi:hypothetical protein
MAPKSRGGGGSLSRRAAVALIGGGGLLGLSGTGAFTQVDSERPFEVSTATGANAIVGIVSQGDVQKNTREAMVQFINNHSAEITVTVTLDHPSDGKLYDNEGGSGASVSFDLPPDNKQFVDINAVIQGEISYSVSVTSANLDLDTNRSVEAVGGNANKYVRVYNLQKFQANSGSDNNWTIDKVQVQDRYRPPNLDYVTYEITDSDGTLRYSETIQISGGQYQDQNLTFSPDDSEYDLPEGEKYTFTATGYDSDGNFGSDTVTATAVGSGGSGGGGGCTIGSNNNSSVLQFGNLQKFMPKKGPNRWDIKQIDVQDADSDKDLNELKFEITDSSGTVRATEAVSISGQQYQGRNLKIQPDDTSYGIVKGETYKLTVTVCDIDGNSRTETRESTA